MSVIDDRVSEVRKFLNVLTWTKILQVITFVIIIFASLFFYEYKESLFNDAKMRIFNGSGIKSLSRKTSTELDEIVAKSDLIVGVKVVFADFQKNVGVVLYTNFDTPELKNVYAVYTSSHLGSLPLFTADVYKNKRLASLINGDFICVPYLDTSEFKSIPEAGKYINTSCANGIPPYYGKFLGIVVIYTRRAPTPEEVDQIRTLIKSVSSMIYDRELK